VAFALVGRHKACFAATLVLVYGWGTLYYYSRQPLYEARASVLVHATGETLSGKLVDNQDYLLQAYLPTHLRLITSSVVLKRAVDKLKQTDVPNLTSLSAEALAGSLSVSLQKDTEILDITYRTTSPHGAARIVESVVAAYMDVVNETHRNTARDILQILTQQKKDLDQQINAKEAQLLALQKSHGVVETGENRGNLALSRVSALNQALSQTRVRRLELQTRYDAVLAARARGQASDPTLDRLGAPRAPDLGPVRPGTESSESSNLQRELLQDQLELERLRSVYGSKHPKIRLLEERMSVVSALAERADKEAARKMRAELELAAQARRRSEAGALQALADELQEMKGLERNLGEQFEMEKALAADFTSHQAPLAALQIDLEQLHKVYDAVIDRIRQIHLEGGYSVLATQLIEPPREPQGPVFPNLIKIMQFCTFLGLFLGLAVCYIFDRWHLRYHSPEDIALHLGLPVLGHIPVLARTSGHKVELWLQHPSHSQSMEAEAFRSLRTALLLCGKPPTKLAITSCGTGDGKTLIVTNLAIAYAQMGMRTLLIDADLRRPRLQRLFDLKEGSGLADLLQQPALQPESVEQSIRQTPLQHLDVLPSGTRTSNPGELLASGNLGAIFSWAERHYQRILCDVSPILAVSDCALLGRWLDGVLLVVGGDQNDRVQTARARALLRSMNCPVTGVIVNRVRSRSAYGYAYYPGYYASFAARSQGGSPDTEAAEAGSGQAA
jgi:polysaccharide biosynthesis transport protein